MASVLRLFRTRRERYYYMRIVTLDDRGEWTIGTVVIDAKYWPELQQSQGFPKQNDYKIMCITCLIVGRNHETSSIGTMRLSVTTSHVNSTTTNTNATTNTLFVHKLHIFIEYTGCNRKT